MLLYKNIFEHRQSLFYYLITFKIDELKYMFISASYNLAKE